MVCSFSAEVGDFERFDDGRGRRHVERAAEGRKEEGHKDRPRRLDEGEEHHGGPGEEVAQNHAALGADFVDEDAGKGAQQAGHDARHGENHAKLPACQPDVLLEKGRQHRDVGGQHSPGKEVGGGHDCHSGCVVQGKDNSCLSNSGQIFPMTP